MHQIVNLRCAVPRVLSAAFGDLDELRAYEREVETARSRQTVRYAVAPRVDLQTLHGLIGPGAEVRIEHLEGMDGLPASQHLARLIADGVVLERG